MFEQENKVNQQAEGGNLDFSDNSNFKKFKPFIIIGASLLLLVFVFIFISSLNKKGPEEEKKPIIDETVEEETEIVEEEEISGLPTYVNLQEDGNKENGLKVEPVIDEEIEYLTFAQFYEKPEKIENFNFLEYELPLEIKNEVINYYDLNRKLNLDAYLDNLSNNGFALINNPWSSQAKDFYSSYKLLNQKDIPFFISSDFLLYHYNLMLKNVFQEIESKFFYDSLWAINLDLYNKAKKRYENYLSEVGDINDPILEAKRLAVAYFAVSLHLLSPESSQVDSSEKGDKNKFSISESYQFKFNMPSYLNNDVLAELRLIRNAKDQRKSPVLLYQRDYSRFSVPSSYKRNARQNNFYLASIWLNSLFPLNYQEDDCPDCLLDKNDWRINFTSSIFITQDISNSQFLKAEWARLYKIISFSSGLKDILTYVYYRNDYEELFGDQEISEVFALDNQEAENNLNKLRLKLLNHEFQEIQGGLDYSLEANKKLAGFQILAEPYWPWRFVFKELSYPNVTDYLNEEPLNNNVTACKKKDWIRCNAFSGDFLSLLDLSFASSYFQENINYSNYYQAIDSIKKQTDAILESRHNAHWSLLSSLETHLNTTINNLPIFAKNEVWQNILMLRLSAALIDWQLGADSFSRSSGVGATKASLASPESKMPTIYIEPSVNLISELMANTQMLSQMLSALGADTKSSQAMFTLDILYNDLSKLLDLSIKSVEKQNLSDEEKILILNWLNSYKIESLASKKISHRSSNGSTLTQELKDLKLLIVVFPTEDGPNMAISPVFNLKESN